MNKIGEITTAIESFAIKHNTELLTGIGLASLVSAIPLTVNATRKGDVAINMAENNGELTNWEKIKVAWKYYIPVGLAVVGGATCVIASDRVTMKRSAALATACKMSETALTEYKNKSLEILGDKKERKIQDAVDKEMVKNNPVPSQGVIYGSGERVVYEPLSGRYFNSNINKIDKIINELNNRLNTGENVSLNELYYELGLPGIELGDIMEFECDGYLIEVDYSAQIDANQNPCIVMNYLKRPKPLYHRW